MLTALSMSSTPISTDRAFFRVKTPNKPREKRMAARYKKWAIGIKFMLTFLSINVHKEVGIEPIPSSFF
jgi:hypothetical protein